MWVAASGEGGISPDAAVQVTVLSIAALKKVSRGTRILLLDRNGGQSKTIAKALSKKGFKKVLIGPALLYVEGFGEPHNCSLTRSAVT